MGAIPVTSRHPNSSMPEVCGAFDLGPTVPRGAVAIQSDPAWLDAWADALVAAAALPPRHLAAHRERMVAWSREAFDWRTVVATWDAHFLGRPLPPQSPPLAEAVEGEAEDKAAAAGPAISARQASRGRETRSRRPIASSSASGSPALIEVGLEVAPGARPEQGFSPSSPPARPPSQPSAPTAPTSSPHATPSSRSRPTECSRPWAR